MSYTEAGGSLRASRRIVTPEEPRPAGLPIGLFGSVMSVAGLAVAWRLAHLRYGVPEAIALAIAVTAVLALGLLAAGYAVKLATAFPAVREELRHPIDSHLFGTLPISLLQLPIVLGPVTLCLARAIWIVGALSLSVFAWLIFSRSLNDRRRAANAAPAWIIPVVGVLNLPLALPTLGLAQFHDLMVAALAIGLFLTGPLFTLVCARLLCDPPAPAALEPSLLILVAPFAVGYSTYTVATGRTDLFAEGLFAVMLFLLAVLLGQLRNLPALCPFRVSWWSASFPLAACSVAALRFASARPGVVTDAIALALLALATLAIVVLCVRTLTNAGELALWSGEAPR